MDIEFPEYSGVRCLMMPYIQGEPDSIPDMYKTYRDIVANTYLERGSVGFLTIDESFVAAGSPHRGQRAKFDRALHTEAGIRDIPGYYWGNPSPYWGGRTEVRLDYDVEILLASNIEASCAVWDAEHADTTVDGDIGHRSDEYPYDVARFLDAGEVARIGILTPHESLPLDDDTYRQFLRIVGSGVHGRESYFTENPLVRI